MARFRFCSWSPHHEGFGVFDLRQGVNPGRKTSLSIDSAKFPSVDIRFEASKRDIPEGLDELDGGKHLAAKKVFAEMTKKAKAIGQ